MRLTDSIENSSNGLISVIFLCMRQAKQTSRLLAPGSALAVLRDEIKQFNFNRLYTVMIFGALFIGAGLFFIPVRGYLYLVGFAVVGLVRGMLKLSIESAANILQLTRYSGRLASN